MSISRNDNVAASMGSVPRVTHAQEQVWHWVLVTRPRFGFSTQAVADAVGVTRDTVRRALTIPRRSGAIGRIGRAWTVQDRRKLLMIWAVFHQWTILQRFVLRCDPAEIEGRMIPEAVFTGPSAFKFQTGQIPSDYDQVWVYLPSEAGPQLLDRFADVLAPPTVQRRGMPNLICLRKPAWIHRPVSFPLIYVDCWQSDRWWSAEFCRALEGQLL